MEQARMQEILFGKLAESLVVPVTEKIALREARSFIQGFRRQGVCCGLSLCKDKYSVEVWRERLEGDGPHIKNRKDGAPLHGVICIDKKELSQRCIFIVWDKTGECYARQSQQTAKLLAKIQNW